MSTCNIFGAIGKGCATYPWEVIFGVSSITAFIMALPNNQLYNTKISDEESCAIDVAFMSIIRLITVLCCCYQFNNLRTMELKYILLSITAMLTAVSSFVFSAVVINILNGDLRDAMFIFLLVLLVNLKKSSVLAQFALSGGSQTEVIDNIYNGVSLLGPSYSLDSIVYTLISSIGMLTGVQRLETLSIFACASFIVNYVVMMTFYPACLSLVLEFFRGEDRNSVRFRGDRSQLTAHFNEYRTDSITQRIKMIMAFGVMIVHVQSWWELSGSETEADNNMSLKNFTTFDVINKTQDIFYGYIYHQIAHLTVEEAVHIVLLMIFLTMAVIWMVGEFYQIYPLLAQENQSLPENTSSNAEQEFEILENIHNNRIETENQETSNVTSHKVIQTETTVSDIIDNIDENDSNMEIRTLDECLAVYNNKKSADQLKDEEVLMLVEKNYIKPYMLENVFSNPERGVSLRRKLIAAESDLADALKGLPFRYYDYSKVNGKNCENVIGYLPIPVGVAGPLLVDGVFYQVPMATTEGCLVASTNRGCRALTPCGGVITRVVDDGMTRGPVVRFSSIFTASEAKLWLDDPENFQRMKSSFDSTSRFARLTKLQVRIASRHLFIRFTAFTGDAMGMNMLSKATEESLKMLGKHFSDMEILSLSGNFCSDKKPAAVNWIEGRGKYVVSEAIVPSKIVTSVLKTTVAALVDVNITKNLMGSAIAGSIGGNNAHAANIVTAIYIATGQDPAQNVTSSNCMTLMEAHGDDLYISCTMPSVEIGTVGGGTSLPGQSACLEMLGVRGANTQAPGDNAKRLARILCATVLAGELSLMSALTAGHLVKSHMALNRSSAPVPADQNLKK